MKKVIIWCIPIRFQRRFELLLTRFDLSTIDTLEAGYSLVVIRDSCLDNSSVKGYLSFRIACDLRSEDLIWQFQQ